MVRLTNRRSLTTQISLMQHTLGLTPDPKTTYRMDATDIKMLFAELKFKLKVKRENDNEMAK